MGHKDLRLGQIVYILVFYKISFSWLLPLEGFQFIFLLRDSENDLLGACRKKAYDVINVDVFLYKVNEIPAQKGVTGGLMLFTLFHPNSVNTYFSIKLGNLWGTF